MRILITGAGGQLGREWVDYLRNSRHQAAGFGSDELDIMQPRQIEEKLEGFRPDLLINCAAFTAVDDAEENIKKAYEINRDGVGNLVEACNKYQTKLLHFSTDYVFKGDASASEKMKDGYDEHHERIPQNVYGASKKEGEDLIEKFANKWLIIRVSWLCGQYGNNFVKTMLRLSREKKQLKVVNDQTGSPTFCFDLVPKAMKLVESGQNGYFHFRSEGVATWYDLTCEIVKLTQSSTEVVPVSTSEFPTKAKRPAFSLLSIKKIHDLGIKPIQWKKGLVRLINQISNEEIKSTTS